MLETRRQLSLIWMCQMLIVMGLVPDIWGHGVPHQGFLSDLLSDIGPNPISINVEIQSQGSCWCLQQFAASCTCTHTHSHDNFQKG